ncbi:MAG: hypothetical protein ACRD26_06980 [Vicinamibacterales bacterium]
MQQELIRAVMEKAAVSEDQARKAAETVVGYLKDKLPSAVSSQLDSATSGGSNLGSIAEGISGKFGGDR